MLVKSAYRSMAFLSEYQFYFAWLITMMKLALKREKVDEIVFVIAGLQATSRNIFSFRCRNEILSWKQLSKASTDDVHIPYMS